MGEHEQITIGGIVLAGGYSRRMGKDKAWIELAGESLLSRVVRITTRVVTPVVVAARTGQRLPGLPRAIAIVRDTFEDAGPLAGLLAGLQSLSSSCDAAFVVCCDQPLLRPAFVHAMIQLMETAPAVIPVIDERIHALTGIYRTSCLAKIEEQLQEGELRAHVLAKRCGAKIVTSDDLSAADPDLVSLLNINSPTDLSRAEQLMENSAYP